MNVHNRGYFLREGGTGHSFPWIYNAMGAVTNAKCGKYHASRCAVPATCLDSALTQYMLHTAEAAESDPTQCIFAQVVSKYISTPVFALQSVVDNHQVCPGCSCDNCTNQQEINEWAIRMVRVLPKNRMMECCQTFRHY
jgi:hypothetical protein